MAKACKINIPYEFTYEERASESSQTGAMTLLLHGFNQTGRSMLKRVSTAVPASLHLISPNGPFPMAQKKVDHYRVGFAWYFYDPMTDEYYIDMDTALEYISQGLKKAHPSKKVTKIISYSQGGYLAPFLAQKLGTVEKVIGVGCEFMEAEMNFTPSFELFAIHGEKDDVVDPVQSQRSFEKLILRGCSGAFHLVAGSGHLMDAAMLKQLALLV